MNRLVAAAIAGLVFGLGLGLSGMGDPARVIGFLDITGAWDPSLLFVMVGAIAAHAPLVRWIRGRGRPFLDAQLHLPVASRIDRRLIVGAAIFGVGWGLVGYCPGPAVLASGGLRPGAMIALAGIVVGTAAVAAIHRRRTEP
jgi:uncharacterized membrane protein YedE/YeeE